MGNVTRSPMALIEGGAATPLGERLDVITAALEAGLDAFTEHPYLRGRTGQKLVVSLVADLPVRLSGLGRAAALARKALVPLCETLCALGRGVAELRLVMATPRAGSTSGPEHLAAYEKSVGDFVRARTGRAVLVAPAGSGSPEGGSGLFSLVLANRELEEHPGALVVVCAADSLVDPSHLTRLDREGLTRSSQNRYGFIPGEGAAAVLLARDETAASLGLRPRAHVVALASAPGEPDGVRAAPLVSVLNDALRGVPPEARLRVFCDMNGDRAMATEYGLAVPRMEHRLTDPSNFDTFTDRLGECGVASSLLAVVLGMALDSGGADQTLVWGADVSGSRAAALLVSREGA